MTGDLSCTPEKPLSLGRREGDPAAPLVRETGEKELNPNKPQSLCLYGNVQTSTCTRVKDMGTGSSHRGTAEMTPTRKHEIVGSIPGLASLSGLRIQRRHELWCRSQPWLGSGVAVAVV